METIKVLGISGSPRPQGNSRFLLEHAIQGAKAVGNFVQTEIYTFGGKNKVFAPCDSCFTCIQSGECRVNDSFQELRDKWLEADAIIYSVPVYHMSYPAQLHAFLDRLGNSLFGTFGSKLPKSLKVIGSIAQGTHIFSGQEHTITDLINHALVMGCIPVTGDLWESYIGVGGWTENDISKKAIAQRYEQGNLDAQVSVRGSLSLGKRVAQVALVIKSGVMANTGWLKEDGGFRGYFERSKEIIWKEK